MLMTMQATTTSQTISTSFGLFPGKISTASSSSTSQELPYVFPKLKTIESMVEIAKKMISPEVFQETAIVGIQHLLETTGSLINGIIACGVPPKNIICSGKFYSTSPLVEKKIKHDSKVSLLETLTPDTSSTYDDTIKKTAENLWETFRTIAASTTISKLVVIDDGGKAIENMPPDIFIQYPTAVAMVEQTRGGLYSPIIDLIMSPLIEVASCAAKRYLESPLIAESILPKLEAILPKGDPSKVICGVIGNGAIGKALVEHLSKKGFSICLFDKNEKTFAEAIGKAKICRVGSAEAVIFHSTYIFDCTGNDVTQDFSNLLKIVKKDKYFICCSSGNIEFKSWINTIEMQDEYQKPKKATDDIVYTTKDGIKVTICHGGFPINFDGEPNCVPPNDIELTRALLFGAFLQAIIVATHAVADGFTINKSEKMSLNPYIQKYVIKLWSASQPEGRYSKELLENFNDISWIIKNSEGKYSPNKQIEDLFKAAIDELEKKKQQPATNSNTASPSLNSIIAGTTL